MEQAPPTISNAGMAIVHSGYSPVIGALALLAIMMGVALFGWSARRGQFVRGLVLHTIFGMGACSLLWLWFAVPPVTPRYMLWFCVEFASPFVALWMLGGALGGALGHYLAGRGAARKVGSRS